MTTHIVTSEQIWDAEKYDSLSHGQYEAAMNVLQHIHFNGDESILDLGCGNGKISAQLALQASRGKVIGIDLSAEMINFSKKRYSRDLYPNLSFLVQDAQALKYKNKFDIIFSSFAIQWIEDKNFLFKKIYKGLQKGGIFAGTIPLQVSSEIEIATQDLISNSKWSKYFKNFSPNWYFVSDQKILHLFNENLFTIKHAEKCAQQMIFGTIEDFIEYIKLWFPYLKPLPEYLRSDFFSCFIDKYLKLMPSLKSGEVILKFDRIDFMVAKSFSYY